MILSLRNIGLSSQLSYSVFRDWSRIRIIKYRTRTLGPEYKPMMWIVDPDWLYKDTESDPQMRIWVQVNKITKLISNDF